MPRKETKEEHAKATGNQDIETERMIPKQGDDDRDEGQRSPRRRRRRKSKIATKNNDQEEKGEEEEEEEEDKAVRGVSQRRPPRCLRRAACSTRRARITRLLEGT